VIRYPMDPVPFTFEFNGSASAYAKIIPQIDVRVDSLVGMYANVSPQVEITGNAAMSGGQLTSADLCLGVSADFNVGLSVFLLGNVGELASFQLFQPQQWCTNYPSPTQLTIRSQPQSLEVVVGGTATFWVDAAASQPISYQWYNNGVPMTGKTSPTLTINSVTLSHAGLYYVRLSSGGQMLQSTTATLTVRQASTPSGMALIPAGSFTMGDSFNEGFSNERPTNSVYVSACYMDRYVVTKSLWDTVKTYNGGNGYSYDNIGSGKAANHPVHTINWYDIVKWCNARSQRDGLTPCYYNEGGLTTVYKTGTGTPYPKWNANGYRLPTEVEWEKAARGGASGHRFPWAGTDNITHSRANYFSSTDDAYDTSPTSGFHPSFQSGGYPYTSPVGYFAANGYGLYDMAGNVLEWCWDWYDDNWYSNAGAKQNDTRGPTGPLIYRVLRGGNWIYTAAGTRCAYRNNLTPSTAGNHYGFRCVRGL